MTNYTDNIIAALERDNQELRRQLDLLASDAGPDSCAAEIRDLRHQLEEQRRRYKEDHEAWQAEKKKLQDFGPAILDGENIWRWMGDGTDKPDSLCCPVLLTSNQLREFVARGAELDEARAELAEYSINIINVPLARGIRTLAKRADRFGEYEFTDRRPDGLTEPERQAIEAEGDLPLPAEGIQALHDELGALFAEHEELWPKLPGNTEVYERCQEILNRQRTIWRRLHLSALATIAARDS